MHLSEIKDQLQKLEGEICALLRGDGSQNREVNIVYVYLLHPVFIFSSLAVSDSVVVKPTNQLYFVNSLHDFYFILDTNNVYSVSALRAAYVVEPVTLTIRPR